MEHLMKDIEDMNSTLEIVIERVKGKALMGFDEFRATLRQMSPAARNLEKIEGMNDTPMLWYPKMAKSALTWGIEHQLGTRGFNVGTTWSGEKVLYLPKRVTEYAIFQQINRGRFRFDDLYCGRYTEELMMGHPDMFPYVLTYKGVVESRKNVDSTMSALFEKFNMNRPEDFMGHSMSVSDILVIDGVGYMVSSSNAPKGFVKLASETLKALRI